MMAASASETLPMNKAKTTDARENREQDEGGGFRVSQFLNLKIYIVRQQKSSFCSLDKQNTPLLSLHMNNMTYQTNF